MPLIPRPLLVFAAAYFASVFGFGFTLGVVRTLWIEPALGPLPAVALELPLMLGLSWWLAGRLLARWPLPIGEALVAGLLAFALLLAAEAGVSLLATGRGIATHLALYRLPEAQLGLAAQALFALMPGWRVRNKSTR